MKKKIAILLVMLMLVQCLSLTGCSESGTNEENTAGGSSGVTSSDEGPVTSVPDEETRPNHQVPDNLDFGGNDFTIAYPMWQGYVDCFFAEEMTGDAMNDAIFERQTIVDEYLNVNIGQVDCGGIADVVTEAKKTITAGDDIYSLVLLHCIQGVAEMVTGGYLYNFDDLQYVDMTADWWNREMMDMLRLGQRTYYGVSDYMIPCPYAIFFNKEVIANNGLESPYQLVYEGNWTLDTFGQYIETCVTDLNGDGKINDEDIWGMATEEISKYISFMTSAGQYLTSRDADGRIELALNTDRMISIVEKMYNIAGITGAVRGRSNTGDDQTCHTLFGSGHVLFQLSALSSATRYRDYDIDIGILPYPKLDAAQENYETLDWGGLMSVPASITDNAFVGAVLEMLSYVSGDTVIPAYYDVLLDGKIARDQDTTAMLDIMFDTITYEIGGNYFGFSGGFSDLFYTMGRMVIVNESSDFASWYKKNEKPAGATIKAFYKGLDKVEGQ